MRIAARLALLTGTAAAMVGGAAGTAMAAPPAGLADSYVVMVQAGVGPASLTARYGGEVAETYSAVDGFSARMTAGQAAHLAADPAVRSVEKDGIVAAAAAPSLTWGVDRLDQRALPLSKSFTAPSASNVTAYVLDGGVRITHKEFGGRASYGWDFVDDDPVAADCTGHGTHVAGTIGGATYGVAKDVKLVAVRVLGCKGSGSYSDIIAGVNWVTEHAKKPAVVNMSLGGVTSKSLDEAVNRSIASGVVYAVSAGNDHRDACRQSPARVPAAITVGATDVNDTRGSFSNYGSCLDIFAPGVRIESASNGSNTATKTMSGTSMASPHVAGAAALVLAVHPDWTPAQVRDNLVAEAGTGLVRSAGSGSPNRLLFTGYLSAVSAAKSH
ncbi:subtilisin family serine protease [Actinoplanes tereljensis]|uniref:Serine protease n=1 Tax=Paractinoplanes tereljensis TaxID=571912 RepID=A0A919TWD1_9ACTN|nr:S8 family peptidase [Actinoplanes tereljensis]GIF24259.1 hypothetical protein Ate02nite_69890 [Actinoplanes tereljensis]